MKNLIKLNNKRLLAMTLKVISHLESNTEWNRIFKSLEKVRTGRGLYSKLLKISEEEGISAFNINLRLTESANKLDSLSIFKGDESIFIGECYARIATINLNLEFTRNYANEIVEKEI